MHSGDPEVNPASGSHHLDAEWAFGTGEQEARDAKGIKYVGVGEEDFIICNGDNGVGAKTKEGPNDLFLPIIAGVGCLRREDEEYAGSAE